MEDQAPQRSKAERLYLLSNSKPNAIFNFGHTINGNIMQFSTEFTHSGWKRTMPKNGKIEHRWYNEVEIGNNSLGFRCDEFVEKGEHDGKHILFSGCSVSWGDGLNKEEAWPWMVYQELSKSEKTSGYFSLAFPGTSIAQQIFWMFRYFKKYGNPDIIFFLMPNLGRIVSIDSEKLLDPVHGMASSIMAKSDDDEYPGSLKMSGYLNFEAYLMLEQYCISNGITLVSSSWSHSESDGAPGNTTETFGDNFESFFKMSHGKVELKFLKEYMEANPDSQLLARDRSHPGTAKQAWNASQMLEEYFGRTS